MACDQIKTELLDLGWDAAERQRIAALLAHVENCPDCRARMAEFDSLRIRLSDEEPIPAPAGGWAAFESRLEQVAPPPHAKLWRIVPLATAASLLLIALAGWQLFLHRPATVPQPHQPEIIAGATPQELAESAKVFRQVSEVFDNRASWILLSRNTSDVGIDANPSDAATQLLLVKLAISGGSGPLSTASVLIKAGRTATVSLPGDRCNVQCQIATSRSEVGHVQLKAEFKPVEAGDVMASFATDLRLQPGRATSAGRIATPLGPYEVSVSIHPMESATRS